MAGSVSREFLRQSFRALGCLAPVLGALLPLLVREGHASEPLGCGDLSVEYAEHPGNPVFSGRGPGHWDAELRERGWILRENGRYRLWYTGYDGTEAGIKRLGYAESADGLHWARPQDGPIYGERWVEDGMVVRDGGVYTLFSEGEGDRAQWMTSPDGLSWTWRGFLDIRTVAGEPIAPGPFGTPTVWREGDAWYLFYERDDRAVWLARSADREVWTHVRDEPVLVPGPEDHDRRLIALNQVFRLGGRYYASYHGKGEGDEALWTVNLAWSEDLVHWKKCPENPLLPAAENLSSGLWIEADDGLRLYTVHPEVRVHFGRDTEGQSVEGLNLSE